MLTTGERMKSRRKELGLSADTVADALGVSRATVFRYERGDIEKLPGQALEPLAKVLCTSVAYLMGWESSPSVQDKSNDLPAPNVTDDVVAFPIMTSVAAHYDTISIDESVEGETADIPRKYLRGRPTSDYCCMRVKGNSMYPDYRDGDVVLILKQSTLNHSGEIGVVIYEDDEMTLKRVNYVNGEDWMELIPLNPSYPPKRIEGEALEHCRVIGIPRLLIRDL